MLTLTPAPVSGSHNICCEKCSGDWKWCIVVYLLNFCISFYMVIIHSNLISLKVMKAGNKNRSTGATLMNQSVCYTYTII